MRPQLLSFVAATVVALALNGVMRPSIELDADAIQRGKRTGRLTLRRSMRSHDLPLGDITVVAQDLKLLFGVEQVRYLLLTGLSSGEAGGRVRLWADFSTPGGGAPAGSRDVEQVSHRTLPVVPRPPSVTAQTELVLPRRGAVEVLGGDLRITSALPTAGGGSGNRWSVRGELDLRLRMEGVEVDETWSGDFKGQLVWP